MLVLILVNLGWFCFGEEEISRIVPVIRLILKVSDVFSIDTFRSAVATVALDNALHKLMTYLAGIWMKVC
jgi:hypothetical protein